MQPFPSDVSIQQQANDNLGEAVGDGWSSADTYDTSVYLLVALVLHASTVLYVWRNQPALIAEVDFLQNQMFVQLEENRLLAVVYVPCTDSDTLSKVQNNKHFPLAMVASSDSWLCNLHEWLSSWQSHTTEIVSLHFQSVSGSEEGKERSDSHSHDSPLKTEYQGVVGSHVNDVSHCGCVHLWQSDSLKGKRKDESHM